MAACVQEISGLGPSAGWRAKEGAANIEKNRDRRTAGCPRALAASDAAPCSRNNDCLEEGPVYVANERSP